MHIIDQINDFIRKTRISLQEPLRLYFRGSLDRPKAIKATTTIAVLVVPLILLGQPFFAISLALGALAGALSETDDHPTGRIKSLALKVVSFALSSLAVELLSPYPVLMALGLFFSTIAFVLIGSLGERYRGVTFGAQLVGLYTMLSGAMSPAWYWTPLLLSGGALFYGLLSLYLLYKHPWRPLEEHLARGFIALSQYQKVKASLFPSNKNIQEKVSNELALLNVQVVVALDSCRDVLTNYRDSVDDSTLLEPYLRYFMLLQNLHERAASSHERHDLLSSDHANTVLLEGIGHTLRQYSHALRKFADCLLSGTTYKHPISIGWMVNALNDQLVKSNIDIDHPLSMIVRNISRSQTSLQNLHEDHKRLVAPKLRKDERTLMQRAKDLLNWQNSRLHHAIRLGICLLVGFTISEIFHIDKGEWIVLTSLFVCQSTYSDTRQRLFQRVFGTLLGVIGGGILILLLPTIPGKLLLLLLSAYAFFLWQSRSYSISVTFVTIYVLCAFNLLSGEGVVVIMPRLIDTLIGSILAFLSVRLLWPHWQYKRLPNLLTEAISKNASYFQTILEEYRQPENEDDLKYRIARREAHRADNALALAWQDMQLEPRNRQQFKKQAFTLTYLNHALLAYISAFGAHRDYQQTLSAEIKELAYNMAESLRATNQLRQPEKTVKNLQIVDTLEQIRTRIAESQQPIHKQQLTTLYNIANVTKQLLKLAHESKLSQIVQAEQKKQ